MNTRHIFGIFHPAQNGSTEVGIIVLSGLQYRVGPHRISVEAARQLSAAGFSVLRMDYPGIGDSEGVITAPHVDGFGTEEVAGAVDFLLNTEEIKQPVVLGICAGARSALRAAATDRRVTTTVLWSIPIRYVPPGSPTARRDGTVMTKEASQVVLKRWMSKLVSLAAWRRKLFSREPKLLPIGEVLSGLVSGGSRETASRHEVFRRAFKSLLSSKRRVAVIYGERDSIWRGEFEAEIRTLRESERGLVDYYVIPGGNHSFASVDAKSQVIDKTIDWLVRQYRPADRRV